MSEEKVKPHDHRIEIYGRYDKVENDDDAYAHDSNKVPSFRSRFSRGSNSLPVQKRAFSCKPFDVADKSMSMDSSESKASSPSRVGTGSFGSGSRKLFDYSRNALRIKRSNSTKVEVIVDQSTEHVVWFADPKEEEHLLWPVDRRKSRLLNILSPRKKSTHGNSDKGLDILMALRDHVIHSVGIMSTHRDSSPLVKE